MEIKIKSNNENKVLERNEIEATALSNSTPKESEVKEKMAEILNTDTELVSVKHIYSSFGKSEYKLQVYVYKNKEIFLRLEKKKEKKGKEAEKQVTETEAKAEKSQE